MIELGPFVPPIPVLLLLHDGGWDEVLMVAVGLGLAYLVIVWTGRRSRTDEDEEAEDGEEQTTEARAADDQQQEHTRSS